KRAKCVLSLHTLSVSIWTIHSKENPGGGDALWAREPVRPAAGESLARAAPVRTAGFPAGQPEHREARRRRRSLAVRLLLASLLCVRGEPNVVVGRRAVVGGSLALEGG